MQLLIVILKIVFSLFFIIAATISVLFARTNKHKIKISKRLLYYFVIPLIAVILVITVIILPVNYLLINDNGLERIVSISVNHYDTIIIGETNAVAVTLRENSINFQHFIRINEKWSYQDFLFSKDTMFGINYTYVHVLNNIYSNESIVVFSYSAHGEDMSWFDSISDIYGSIFYLSEEKAIKETETFNNVFLKRYIVYTIINSRDEYYTMTFENEEKTVKVR